MHWQLQKNARLGASNLNQVPAAGPAPAPGWPVADPARVDGPLRLQAARPSHSLDDDGSGRYAS